MRRVRGGQAERRHSVWSISSQKPKRRAQCGSGFVRVLKPGEVLKFGSRTLGAVKERILKLRFTGRPQSILEPP